MTGVAGILSTQVGSRTTTGVGKGVVSAKTWWGIGCSTGVLSAQIGGWSSSMRSLVLFLLLLVLVMRRWMGLFQRSKIPERSVV
jgi:hypothetical protein